MEKEKIYKALHDAFVAVTKIKKGDVVKITRSFVENENGCDIYWTPRMEECVGKTGVVYDIYRDRFNIKFKELGETWCLPYFCIEIVGEVLPEPIYLNEAGEYKAEFKTGGQVVVGCQTICFNVLESIYETAKKVKDKN